MDDKHADHDDVDADLIAGTGTPDAGATSVTADPDLTTTPDTARTSDTGHAADTGRGSIGDLDDAGHLFDQTNGLADGLNGDSDGTADADDASAADRGTDGDGVNPGTDAGTGILGFNQNDRI